jgi:hypothetical protein
MGKFLWFATVAIVDLAWWRVVVIAVLAWWFNWRVEMFLGAVAIFVLVPRLIDWLQYFITRPLLARRDRELFGAAHVEQRK